MIYMPFLFLRCYLKYDSGNGVLGGTTFPSGVIMVPSGLKTHVPLGSVTYHVFCV